MGFVPEVIKDTIGQGGWNSLSWALHHGWVQDSKYLLSQKEGFDVGVSETVRVMLDPDLHDTPVRRIGPFKDYHTFRQLLIEGYLLGTDFVSNVGNRVVPDEDGRNQLEGELRRFCAIRRNVSPREIILKSDDVHTYCEFHKLYGLDGNMALRFSERLFGYFPRD